MADPGASGGSRFAFIAVLGAPNAGKSTLINHMVGAKVSIVSPKVQTTRARVLGIMVSGDSQLVFVDTPGRSEEHTSELQSLMRISYAVFCLKKKNTI